MSELQLGVHIIIAAVLGGMLGWQRARWGKSAGTRTYALVTAGAALFTLMARYGFGGSTTAPNIAAQIVTGIGFLGAGLIFHRGTHVDGLTTAAGLWAAAAIGMAVGLSFYIVALIATAVIFFVLMLDPNLTDLPVEVPPPKKK